MKKIIPILVCSFVFISTMQAQEWIQIGNNIEGEASGDRYGYSVALTDDGMIMVSGVPYNDSIGLNAGQVKVHQYQSGNWIKLEQKINGEAAGDNFGISVSISSDGSVIAAGARNNDGNGSSAGHVRIFELQDGTWVQIGEDIDGEAAGDRSGVAISLSSSGSILAIGADNNDGTDNNAGHVRVYENQSGTWTQIGQDIDGEAANDKFGTSVSLNSSGSIIAIGAPYNDNSAYDAGNVRIYENQSGTWTQIGQSIEGAEEEHLGSSVSLSSDGSIIAIGVVGKNDYSGSVRVYENQSGTWTQIGQDIDGEGIYDEFGTNVDLSSDGSIVAIGAPFNSMNGSEAGLVGIYENQSGNWSQIGQSIIGANQGDECGSSVRLSSNGSILAAGSPYSDGNETSVGHVSVFELHYLPTIISHPADQTNVCPESNISFTVAGEDIDTYQWQVDEGGGFINISNGAVYNNTNTATLNIDGVTIGMNNNQYRCVVGNLIDSVTSEFALLTTDATNPEIICVGNQEFNADETHFYTVQNTELDPLEASDNCGVETIVNDFNDSSSLSGEQIPEGTTTIAWTITDNAGNTNTCSIEVIVNAYVALTGLQQKGIVIYPNPVNDMLNIDFSNRKVQKLTISDISGKPIFEKTQLQGIEGIDLSNFPGGIYLVSIVAGNEIITSKLVKH
ncbi:hypothetical protein L21SP5_00275 [Salinivirga cyanobacteriivorans]|uniref:HYR domain-containing protein n=1 Tax=Salinivirga cyanobacteriivorans TaxID=1307839 RepID=A0A0S2HV57_9BACT|nr:T9SS type A sorting domain-containing protein [Salinivirga cyanobacteriivorans]ALO13955.1 hypothetical protein L21SP5_00275 [Salinivirga cyanobacteriivorans]